MKSPLRTLLVVATSFILVALLAWVSTFLYWHVRISGAIRTLDQDPSGVRQPKGGREQDAFVFLANSGCRMLPYAVRALDPSKDPEFSDLMLDLIQRQVRSLRVVTERFDDDAQAELRFLPKCVFYEQDTSEIRELKSDRLHVWWEQKGDLLHQWWRVWSSECGR